MSYKHMWKCVWSTMLLFCLIACDDEIVYLPKDDSCIMSFGTMLNQAQQGRPFEVGCQLKLSEHATRVVAEWSVNASDVMPEDSRKGHTSYKTFSWDNYGKKEVTCKVSYTYGDKAKTLEYSQSFDVIPPLYKDIFLQDNMDVVKKLYPEATEIDLEKLRNVISETEYDEFSFMDDQLEDVRNVQVIEPTEDVYTYLTKVLNNNTSEHIVEKNTSTRIVRNPEGLPDDSKEFLEENEENIYRLMQKINSGMELTEQEKKLMNDIYKMELIELRATFLYDYNTIQYLKTIDIVCSKGQEKQLTTYRLY